MDITLTDNGNGVYEIQDTDLQTLSQSILIDNNYNGTQGHLVKLPVSALTAAATDYDPQAEANAIQSQIDTLTAQLTPLQAQATALIALKATPIQPLTP